MPAFTSLRGIQHKHTDTGLPRRRGNDKNSAPEFIDIRMEWDLEYVLFRRTNVIGTRSSAVARYGAQIVLISWLVVCNLAF